MYKRRGLIFGLLAAVLLPAQEAQPTVEVTGAVKQALTLTAADLAKMPRASVRTTSNGMETLYEGVWLYEVLKKAGVPQGRFKLVVPKDKHGSRSVRMLTRLDVVQARK